MNSEHDDDELLERTIEDTYEAAYYIMYGATFIDVTTTTLPDHRSERRGYRTQWHIHLSGIPRRCFDDWKCYRAGGNYREMVAARIRLKLKIKKHLYRAQRS